MFFLIAAVPGAFVGALMASIGYLWDSWQFWAATLFTAFISACVNSLRTHK